MRHVDDRIDPVKRRIDEYDLALTRCGLTVQEIDELRWRKRMLQEVMNGLIAKARGEAV